MPLSKLEEQAWRKGRAPGAGSQAVGLDDGDCGYLLSLIARDLKLGHRVPELAADPPDFFGSDNVLGAKIEIQDPKALYAKLVEIERDVSLYFFCLRHFRKRG